MQVKKLVCLRCMAEYDLGITYYIYHRRTCLGEEEVGSHLNLKFQIHVPVLSP